LRDHGSAGQASAGTPGKSAAHCVRGDPGEGPGLSARDVIPHIGPPTVHYNTLLRALVDTSKLDGLQRLLDRAQRAARDQGIAVDPPPNIAGLGLDDAFFEVIRAVLDAARAAEKTLVYREAPALAVVPRGTTFEEAARRDPSLLDRIKRAPRIPPSAS